MDGNKYTHDVFISFSFTDQTVAEYIVNTLSSKYGISCWICTRDIAGGSRYKKLIPEAIHHAKAVVFLQSSASIASQEVPKEIGIAFDADKIIIPFKLDNSKLTGALLYDLYGVEYIDGTVPSFDERVKDLAMAIKKVISPYSRTTSTTNSIPSSKATPPTGTAASIPPKQDSFVSLFLKTLEESTKFFTTFESEKIAGTNKYKITRLADTEAKSVVIPDFVAEIGDNAFEDCTNLTSIVIPDSVTSIGHYKVNIERFDGGYTFHSGGGSTFANCTSLKSVSIGKGITSIPAYAFSGCTSLTSVTIPNSVTHVGAGAFEDCTALTNIIIPDSVTKFSDDPVKEGTTVFCGSGPFQNCTSLKSVTIGKGVTSIPSNTFSDCTSLTDIIIPDNVTVIEDSAFANCTSLRSVVIPTSVTVIEDSAFSGCTSLKNIIVPNNVISIGGGVFSDCTSLKSVLIGNGVTSISSAAFDSCTSLQSVTIPHTITNIEQFAFANCTSLFSFTIPESVTNIDDFAFAHCTSLKKITIAQGVTNIGYDAFKDCTCLENITFNGTVAKWNAISFGDEWNDNVPATKVICSDGIVTLS